VYDARSVTRTEIMVEGLRSLAWTGDELIDWVGGRRIRLDGTVLEFGVGDGYRFDGGVGFGDVGVVFETLGTKGRIVRWNGQVARPGFVPVGFDEVREIDRSYYHATAYDYPICLLTLPEGQGAIAHCPKRYDTLEIELLDGTPLTSRRAKAEDIFHARLAASPDGRWLLDNGWVWHPLTIVAVYDVARALREPEHLSSTGIALDLGDTFDGDVEAAIFSGDRLIVAGGDAGRTLSIVDLPSGKNIATVSLATPVGTRLMPWDRDHVVALDVYPRLLALADGKVVHQWEAPGPAPRPSPSVSLESPSAPYVAIDPRRARFAIADDHRVVVISAD
jgi:hypothetical protein